MTAFIVFPMASRSSVVSRTFLSSPAITAIPPALSVIGPNASSAMMIPDIDNIDITATAMP